MKVPCGEGVANHTGPESCANHRKGVREALTGESAGRVLSRESKFRPGCRRCLDDRKATQGASLWREAFWPCVVGDPVHAQKLPAREPGDPTTDLGG